jgi:hypothetical protein
MKRKFSFFWAIAAVAVVTAAVALTFSPSTPKSIVLADNCVSSCGK